MHVQIREHVLTQHIPCRTRHVLARDTQHAHLSIHYLPPRFLSLADDETSNPPAISFPFLRKRRHLILPFIVLSVSPPTGLVCATNSSLPRNVNFIFLFFPGTFSPFLVKFCIGIGQITTNLGNIWTIIALILGCSHGIDKFFRRCTIRLNEFWEKTKIIKNFEKHFIFYIMYFGDHRSPQLVEISIIPLSCIGTLLMSI
jgi:hypothetical protein